MNTNRARSVVLGEQMRRLRVEGGSTQQQIATRMGTTQSVVARLEAGDRVPSLVTLERVADALGASLEVFLRSDSRGDPIGSGVRRDRSAIQVFVSGTWKADKAASYRAQAALLGRALADAGVDLACGPGTGIARHVIDGYRTRAKRGAVRYYLPERAEMVKAGETVEKGADEIIQTTFDYPMRNVWQVKQSQGVFILTGGDGTLEEALPALIDYGHPVAAVAGSGSAADGLQTLLNVYPTWADQLLIGADVECLLGPFLDRVRLLATGRDAGVAV